MFLPLLFGGVGGVAAYLSLARQLAAVAVEIRTPALTLTGMNWNDLLIGTAFLGLPQVPLTRGNAIIAVTAENNRPFPDRQVTEQRVAISTDC